MKECLVVTMRSDSSPRRSGRLVRLLLVATALLLTAACSEPPAPAPTPVVQVAVQPTVRPTAEATPTRTPTPTAVPTATAVPTPAGPPVFPVDPTTVVPPGTRLQDPQEVRVPNGHGGVAPWRDGGGQRIFSTWVYGTVYQIDEFGVMRPYIGISHEVNDAKTVWTVKLREDAVFQDGTPITAADFKAYWEHGAKPENIVAWGGASLSIGDILGWEELRAGDVTEAEGLTVIDDQTLEVTTVIPFPTWPLAMASWHSGISKLDQVQADEEWFTHPSLRDPTSGRRIPTPIYTWRKPTQPSTGAPRPTLRSCTVWPSRIPRCR